MEFEPINVIFSCKIGTRTHTSNFERIAHQKSSFPLLKYDKIFDKQSHKQILKTPNRKIHKTFQLNQIKQFAILTTYFLHVFACATVAFIIFTIFTEMSRVYNVSSSCNSFARVCLSFRLTYDINYKCNMYVLPNLRK
jgi:hypothetical protein